MAEPTGQLLKPGTFRSIADDREREVPREYYQRTQRHVLILGVGEITGVGVGVGPGTGTGIPGATVTVTDADLEPPVPLQVTVY